MEPGTLQAKMCQRRQIQLQEEKTGAQHLVHKAVGDIEPHK